MAVFTPVGPANVKQHVVSLVDGRRRRKYAGNAVEGFRPAGVMPWSRSTATEIHAFFSHNLAHLIAAICRSTPTVLVTQPQRSRLCL
jgi:hypothetical protein